MTVALVCAHTGPPAEVLGCISGADMRGEMAAAAVAEMVGGFAEAVENATSPSLYTLAGLPCGLAPRGQRTAVVRRDRPRGWSSGRHDLIFAKGVGWKHTGYE